MFDSAIKFQQSAMLNMREDLNFLINELLENDGNPTIMTKYTLTITKSNRLSATSEWHHNRENTASLTSQAAEAMYRDLMSKTLNAVATELSKMFFDMDSLIIQVRWYNRAYDSTDAFGVGGYRFELDVFPVGENYPDVSEKLSNLTTQLTKRELAVMVID